jgi:hypothetical protein
VGVVDQAMVVVEEMGLVEAVEREMVVGEKVVMG